MIIEALERELPPASLLLGPDVAGLVNAAKWTTHRYGVVQADRVILRHVRAVDARNLVRFAQTAPFGPFKLVIAALDGSTLQAQNILLKVLEEPPLLESGETAIRFILIASARPLPTIVSRCQVITVPGEAGPPEADQKVTAQVAAALNAATAGDLRGLDVALAGWGDSQRAALEDRLTETALSGPDAEERWRARRLLGALGRFAGAHPRLAAHAAFVTVLIDKERHD